MGFVCSQRWGTIQPADVDERSALAGARGLTALIF